MPPYKRLEHGSDVEKAVVCGAGGFIGSHLVRRLKASGVWVRGVDVKRPAFSPSPVDEFLILDLRDPASAATAVTVSGGCDAVFQLAADMGGMGFIDAAECEVLHNNALIDLNMVHAAASAGIGRYFFSSSVCIYRDMAPGEPELDEAEAYPAMPDNEYGWEKLYAERVALAYARRFGMGVRIARFQNCYGPEGAWRGGREKAPAALCRKVAEVDDGGVIEVWGDGTAVRSFVYVDDLVEAVLRLVESDCDQPVNIGTAEYVSVQELVDLVGEVAGKNVEVKYVPGPVGVQSRNFSHRSIEALGWQPRHSLHGGLSVTYPWIAQQVALARQNEHRGRA
jgi:nucleoside-diphosphate-sugar epimerase